MDYVLERGGTEDEIGTPVAFIEIAWRRYTKHSKNKSQEIEGALIPLSITYENSRPLLGAILAGDFTTPSISQLRSRAFQVLYIPVTRIWEAFDAYGIDAKFNESTTEDEFNDMISAWQQLSDNQLTYLQQEIIQSEQDQVDAFVVAVGAVLSRTVTSVSITALHGVAVSLESVVSAIAFLRDHSRDTVSTLPLLKYELTVRYSNGDNIFGTFADRKDAITFLESFLE